MTGSGLGTGAQSALTVGESRRKVGSGVSVWLWVGGLGLARASAPSGVGGVQVCTAVQSCRDAACAFQPGRSLGRRD